MALDNSSQLATFKSKYSDCVFKLFVKHFDNCFYCLSQVSKDKICCLQIHLPSGWANLELCPVLTVSHDIDLFHTSQTFKLFRPTLAVNWICSYRTYCTLNTLRIDTKEMFPLSRKSSVSDQYSLNPDPDPAKNLKTDPEDR